MEDLIHKTARLIADSRHVVALTGAGISVESGIPPFRGPGGLWEKFDPMEVGHIQSFMRDPEKVWRLLISEMRDVLMAAKPNPAHLGLARLEEMGILKTVITQNVDGLHQTAGSRDVVEFHGNFAWLRCLDCGGRVRTVEVDLSQMPPRCDCGGIFRPECVFFGEMIPPLDLDRAQIAASSCDVMLVVGCSAVVQPAAYMPVIARQSGAVVIEINPEPTPLTGRTSAFLIQGKAGPTVEKIVAGVTRIIADKRR
ncbi:MAG: RNA polymerase subunit sigma [Desulfobacterales bacterium CG23_combo_of_CG06-09_8_20_14_all_51_8]|nr:MAG: RNA polymerase subunit sigma [Desulfobacterales bacterium CG23_combo_of_CG06-09_8_20_14_all_51_8]